MPATSDSQTSVSLLERLRQDPTNEQAWGEFVDRYRGKITACRDDLFFRRQESMRQNLSPQFRRCHDRGAFLAHRDRGRRIRHPHRRLPISARRKRRCKHRGDGVART